MRRDRGRDGAGRAELTPEGLVHALPVWRQRADLIVAAYIDDAGAGGPNWEQLWAQRTGPGRAILCCIPFYVYDLSLGDEVAHSPEHVVSARLRRSGQWTLRAWFGEVSVGEQDDCLRQLAGPGVLVERASAHLVAFSVAGEASAQALADALHVLEQAGRLTYETGASA